MIRKRVVATFASALIVLAPSALLSQESSPPPSDRPVDEQAKPAGQEDVEAQLTKLLEELRRANAKRATPTPARAPSASPAPSAKPRATLPKPTAGRLSPVGPGANTSVTMRPAPPAPEPPVPPAVDAPAATAEVVRRPPLPPIEGFTSAEVRDFLGAPHQILQGATGVTAWYYATPSGRLAVYFVADHATAAAPATKRGAPPPVPTRRVPGELASCDGTRAIPGLKALVVHMPDAPAFIEPRLRAVPLATLAAGEKLEVNSVDGAWYLVRFKDERWGTRVGYVHCSDVKRPQP